MRTLRVRLFILLALLIAICVGGLALIRQSECSPVMLLQADSELRSANLLKRVMHFKGEALATHVYDYSLWDEMVDAVAQRDHQWCDKYLLSGLHTFSYDQVWLCDTNMQVIYSADKTAGCIGLVLPVPVTAPHSVFETTPFPHYFVKDDTAVFEVCAAPVHPVTDTARLSRPRGYYFVAKRWSEEHIDGLSLHAEATVSLAGLSDSSDAWTSEPEYGIIRFSDTLHDWAGTPVSLVRAEAFSRSLLDLKRSANHLLWICGAVAALLFALCWCYLTFLVIRPLKQISAALDSEMVDPISELALTQSELGAISRQLMLLLTKCGRQGKEEFSQDRVGAAGEVRNRTTHISSP